MPLDIELKYVYKLKYGRDVIMDVANNDDFSRSHSGLLMNRLGNVTWSVNASFHKLDFQARAVILKTDIT